MDPAGGARTGQDDWMLGKFVFACWAEVYNLAKKKKKNDANIRSGSLASPLPPSPHLEKLDED